MTAQDPRVAIVDYGLGNLFSIGQACAKSGGTPVITSSWREIKDAEAVVLPGVGAFGDAMRSLRALGLVEVLRDLPDSGVPLIGICLGLQLLFQESSEFGVHEGLGLIEGNVSRLPIFTGDDPNGEQRTIKVPSVGWYSIEAQAQANWSDSLLRGIDSGTAMYFVHSYYADPLDPSVILSHTSHGDLSFSSSIQQGTIFGCQFHPERSGNNGLRVYQNLISSLKRREPEQLRA